MFLAADSEDVARVYGRIGFRRIGTACIAEPASAPAAGPEPAPAAAPEPAPAPTGAEPK